MTVSDYIKKTEADLQQCNQQIQQWHETRLRAEGALIILRKMKEEEDAANCPTNPPDTSAADTGV